MLPVNLIIVIIAFIGNIFLGLFTLLKNPRGATNRLFFLFTLNLTVYLILNYLVSLQNTDQSAFFFVKMVMTIALFINLLFFLLTSTFPSNTLQTSKKVLWLSLIATLLLVLAAQTNLIFVSAPAINKGVGAAGPAMPLFLLHTVLFLGSGFFILIKKFRNSVGREKVQIKLFLLGAVLMFVSILVTNLLFVLIFNTGQFISLLPFYILFFLGFISYAIVKHRFLDIGLVVTRTVSFTLLVLLFALFYGILFASLSSLFIASIQMKTIIISAFLAIIMAFTFQPLRRVLEKITAKIFYKQGYSSQELLFSLSRIMASKIILSELVDAIMKKLFEEMKISTGSFVLMRGFSIICSTENDSFKNSLKLQEQKLRILIDKIVKTPGENLMVFDELEESDDKNFMREYGLSMIIPLIVNNEVIGAMLFGNKLSGDIYSSEDLAVLKILAPEVAVAIKNALSFDEINKFNITLKEEVERQTRQLKDLTEQQKDQVDIMGHEVKTPLTAISQQLNLLLEMILTDEKREEWFKGIVQPEDAKRVIEGLKKMQIAETQEESIVTNMIEAARLDKLRFELNYSTFNLIDLVKLAIKDSEARFEANKQTGHITLQSELPKLEVEADKTRIKQCIDGLLTNAEKYGRNPETHSLNIVVSVTADDQAVSISVRDQGMGIDSQDMDKLGKKFSRLNSHANGSKLTRPGGSGLGLYTYKGIIEKHKGQLLIESDGIGKGSTFKLKFPKRRSSKVSMSQDTDTSSKLNTVPLVL